MGRAYRPIFYKEKLMLSFSFSPLVEIILLCVVSVLVTLSYLLMLLLSRARAKYVIYAAVPLHLLLVNALFSIGATVDIVALVFLGLLFLYVCAYAIRTRLIAKSKGGEKYDV